MDKSMEYERMLNMEASSCEVYFKPVKRVYKRKKVKSKMLKDVNDKLKDADIKSEQPLSEVNADENNIEERNTVSPKNGSKVGKFFKKVKKNFKFDIISAQVAVIFVLVIAILLTNIFWENSGMNVLLKDVFSIGNSSESDKKYVDFTVNAPETLSEIKVEDGVMAFTASGSVYAPCEGKVDKVNKDDDGTYCIEIKHSDSFSTRIEGLNYAYYFVGEDVYKSTPIGYSNGGKVEVKFFSNGEVVKNYTVTDGMVVWQV